MECPDISPWESEEPEDIQITVDEAGSGVRFDHLLVQHLPDVSRSVCIASIRAGLLLVDGQQKKSSYRLKEGQRISGSLLVAAPPDVLPEEISFPILYEDADILVLSKPPGLVVHPGSGNFTGTLVNGLVYHCRSMSGVGDEVRPGIVHRLDKDTSGVMVTAKTEAAHRALVEAFRSRQVKKEYLALVHGTFVEQSGRLVAAIGRHPVNRQKMAVREKSGRYAVTNWRVIEEFPDGFSLLRVHIETGRTHQIRVHMAHLGHSVAGDRVYGANRDNRLFARQMLHAYQLMFRHPVRGDSLSFAAPLWEDFNAALAEVSHGEYRFAE